MLAIAVQMLFFKWRRVFGRSEYTKDLRWPQKSHGLNLTIALATENRLWERWAVRGSVPARDSFDFLPCDAILLKPHFPCIHFFEFGRKKILDHADITFTIDRACSSVLFKGPWAINANSEYCTPKNSHAFCTQKRLPQRGSSGNRFSTDVNSPILIRQSMMLEKTK